MPENEPSSAAKADLLPRAMAPSASKNCFSARNVRMHILALVAHKNSPDTLHNLDFSVMKDADGVFFIDDRDSYTEVLAKMATHCRKPVSRIFYIDSDDDELPIDSEVEFKEALKLIGQRTNKGQVTSMRIETGGLPKNEKKRVKKHSKVARVKVAAKPSDSSPPKKITSTNKAESEPTLQKVSTSDESSIKIKHGVSQTWLKNYLQEFKKELMADFESLLEPYVAEQKKMADMITSLNAALMSNKNCSETVAIINTKEQTEFDHNYSASASCMNAQLAKDLAKPKLDEIIHLSDDEELVLPCSSFDEDDNLSIYSGEISVTESESDGSADDFVEVPLPSCFDVVAIQGGSTHKKGPKEMKHMKTSLKVKVGKMGREVIAKCEEKPHSKTNAKPEVNCNFVMRNPFTSNQVLPEQSTAPPSVEKPQPHTSANVSPMAPALGNTNNVRLGMGYTAQPMHPYFQSYISPLSMLGSETVCSMLADPLANQDANMAYRMRPVGAVGASTFGPSYPLIWGQNVSTYTTAQTLGQTQTQPTMLGQPQAPQPQAPATVPRQLPQQMLPMQLALHHPHQPAMAQLAPMQPQLQPQLLPPLQPLQAQLQHISRDDTTARGNSQDSSRIESAFSGMQLHDFTPVAPDTTSVCYSRPTPAGFCPKTFGGIMKN